MYWGPLSAVLGVKELHEELRRSTACDYRHRLPGYPLPMLTPGAQFKSGRESAESPRQKELCPSLRSGHSPTPGCATSVAGDQPAPRPGSRFIPVQTYVSPFSCANTFSYRGSGGFLLVKTAQSRKK